MSPLLPLFSKRYRPRIFHTHTVNLTCSHARTICCTRPRLYSIPGCFCVSPSNRLNWSSGPRLLAAFFFLKKKSYFLEAKIVYLTSSCTHTHTKEETCSSCDAEEQVARARLLRMGAGPRPA